MATEDRTVPHAKLTPGHSGVYVEDGELRLSPAFCRGVPNTEGTAVGIAAVPGGFSGEADWPMRASIACDPGTAGG